MKRILLAYLVFLVLPKAWGQVPGTLDSSFNGKGWIKLHFAYGLNTNDEVAYKTLVKSDGKYLVIVNTYFSTIAQYNANGTLDNTFGEDGFSETSPVYNATGALQTDGKIVVGGSSYHYPTNGDFTLFRYNADGTIDRNFGTDGEAYVDFFGQEDHVYAMTLQDDGKVLMAGYCYNPGDSKYYFALARFTTEGTADSSFGTNGKVTTEFGVTNQNAYAVALQSGGKIIIAGSASGSGGDDFVLARFTTDGTPDSSFGTNGKVRTDLNGSYDQLYSLAIRGDSILAGGVSVKSEVSNFTLVRYTPDGSIDSSFGLNGIAYAEFGNDSQINSLALANNNTIVAAGYVYYYNPGNDSWAENLALARFKPDGTLDSSFGTNGLINSDIGGRDDALLSAAVLENGSVVTSGTTFDTTINNYDFILLRYDIAGVPDNSFNGTGLVKEYYRWPVESYMGPIALQPDGKKVVGGEADIYDEYGNYTYVFALARVKTDGTLDSSFGTNGRVITQFPEGDASAYVLGIRNNYIYAGGYGEHFIDSTGNYDEDFALARYTMDGILDSSFGTNGIVTTDIGGSYEYVNAMAFLNTGEILLGGQALNQSLGENSFAMAAYTTAGTLFSGFGSGGKVITDMFGYESGINALAVLGDDRIIAAGTAVTDTSYVDFALARYMANGTLDPTFGTGGKVNTDFGNWESDGANSVIIQPDGKIVAGGWTELYNDTVGWQDDYALARYNANGSLDPAFGTNGKITTGTGYSEEIRSLTLQKDGKIIGAGMVQWSDEYGYYTDLGLSRYSSNGAPDAGFGSAGKIQINLFGNHNQYLYSSLWDSGKLYTAGYFYPITGNNAGYIAAFYTGGNVPAGNPLVSINDVTVSENAGTATLTISLDRPATVATTINFATADSTAVSKGRYTDYKALKGTVTIGVGGTSAQVNIGIKSDNQNEGNEYFKVLLSLNRKMISAVKFGDSVGVVTIVNVSGLSSEVNANNGKAIQEMQSEKLSVKASPNPSSSYFTLQVQTSSNAPVNLIVTDASGRVMESKTVFANRSLQIGSNYRPGVYYAELVQNDQKVVVKLLKQ